MKKNLRHALIILMLVSIKPVLSQNVSTFEGILTSPNTYYNGSDFAKGFTNGNAFFTNIYDTSWGFPSWSGFAVSNLKDDSTAGFSNQYSAITGSGVTSESYGVYFPGGTIRLGNGAKGWPVHGFYITNSTYTYYDMKQGSSFSKKFGGPTGNDPDFLKVIVNGWKSSPDSGTSALEIYLADFRFEDNSKDYILDEWKWIDLNSLGALDSLTFTFESSDTGTWGINTPQYFCLDNFNETPTGISVANLENNLLIYPNPTRNVIHFNIPVLKPELFIIRDLNGKELLSTEQPIADVSLLASGTYIAEVRCAEGSIFRKFIKSE